MTPYEDNLLVKWREANRPNWATTVLISQWLEAAIAPEEALHIEEEFDAWHRDRSLPEPDLVSCVAWYGYGRLLIQGWTRIPIDIPDRDLQRWRDAEYLPTVGDLQERLASAAGGFLELAGHAPDLTIHMIARQIEEKLLQLDGLAALPLQRYTPRRMTEDEILDGDDSWEQDQFDRPFVLRERLECFEWGLEKLRILIVAERSRGLNLPNRELYDALMRIDLNVLLARLKEVDGRLRVIWRHLAGDNYYGLNSEIAPERFWWRHWTTPASRRSPISKRPRTRPTT